MNRSAVVLFAVLAALTFAATAQNSLEIIALRHRTVDQVIPVLQPLVEPGGTLSGQGTQLFVRTSAANLSDIRLALESIDRPPKRLVISVRIDDSLDAANREIGAGGRISNRGSNVEIRAQDSRVRADERVDQRVQTIEGGRAMIMTGASRPVRQRQLIQTPAGVVSQEVTVLQEQASGFEVIPRLAGNVVQVEIAQQHVSQRAASTVNGRLGEWFELGAVAVNATRDASGIASRAQSSGGETRRVWIRVDEVP
jgi:hypothetical protein